MKKNINYIEVKQLVIDSVETSNTSLTKDGWSEWLKQRQEMFKQKYCIDPDQLTADQRREQGISRDYQGREILELLQNAADAAKSAGIQGKVHLELSEAGLIVANTGSVFSVGGVKSLQTPDLSPKLGKNSQLIGCKGLGFRSVLNWTRHPIILSGCLRLVYNVSAVKQLVNELYQTNENIRLVLKAYRKPESLPTPLLPFPLDLNLPESHRFLQQSQLFSRCETVKASGFDTVIGMPFDNASAFSNAFNQLEQLRPEFLLFAEGIEQLDLLIESSDLDSVKLNTHKTWKAQAVKDNLVLITEIDHEYKNQIQNTWHLYSEKKPIDRSCVSDEGDPDNYHLVVAFLDEGLAEPGNLYSFFPTSIPMPIHALCHATLELEQNRKHLQEGPVNKFILRRLAEFVAIKIEEQARKSNDGYHALSIIAPEKLLKDYQVDIAEFRHSFIDALKEKKILPTLSTELMSADQVKSFPSNVRSYNWLPSHIFSNIVTARSDADKQLFDLFGVDEIAAEEFVNTLKQAELTLTERSDLILGIVEYHLGKAFCYKGLLLDIEGNTLDEADRVFQPGVSLTQGFHLPAWANIKILHPDLWQLLRIKKLRESVEMLKDFDLREYGLANLILAVIPAANRAIEQNDEDAVRSDLLQVLYQLYCLFGHADERPVIPKATVFALNQTNEWCEINALYFGKGYSKTGEIIGDLYKATPEKLLALPENYLALDIKTDHLLGFFEWLGAAQWPRYIQNTIVEKEFKDYVFDTINYPAVFVENDHYRFESREELPRNCSFRHVQSLDGLDSILSSSPSAILAWLASDVRAMTWGGIKEEHGVLKMVPLGCQNDRVYQGGLPSYIFWKVKYQPWLLSTLGESVCPAECVINDAAVSGIFPKPATLSKEQLEQYGISNNNLKYAWVNAGVRGGVEDLDSDEIYKILLELPDIDPTGKLAKKLYNWLIKTVDFEPDVSGNNYQQFCEKGFIYSLKGDEEAYRPVPEVYHVDVEGFPVELLKSLPIATLLKKRGASKVRRLFGVNVLDKQSVNERVTYHIAADCAVRASESFQQCKNYIKVYRHNHTAKSQQLNIFERLELVVCVELKSEIIFNEQVISSLLPPWTYSIQDNRLYVSCDPLKASDASNPLLANTIGDAIASIFGIVDGTPFAQLYQCDQPSRMALLQRMLGDDLGVDIQEYLQALQEELDQTEQNEQLSLGVISSTMPITSPQKETTKALDNKSSSVSNEPDQGVGWILPEEIGVASEEHVPKKPSVRSDLKITNPGGSSSSGSSGKGGGRGAGSDGKAGEELAMLFETQQGRYPLYVGDRTGYKTISSDVLSFRSSEDRELFRSGENQTSSLIERVIEAKEKWHGGLVELSHNEVTEAAKWRKKYFIYRFKVINANRAEYELKTLCDPLSQLEAVVSKVEISLDAASTSEQFRVFDVGRKELG